MKLRQQSQKQSRRIERLSHWIGLLGQLGENPIKTMHQLMVNTCCYFSSSSPLFMYNYIGLPSRSLDFCVLRVGVLMVLCLIKNTKEVEWFVFDQLA